MLEIRKAQMETLGNHMAQRFEEWAIAHVRRYFRASCRELGDDGTREMVQYGIERAEAHGFTAESDIGKYLDVMFTFGRDFDNDPALPWARRILEDPSVGSAEARINALCDEAVARQETDRRNAP